MAGALGETQGQYMIFIREMGQELAFLLAPNDVGIVTEFPPSVHSQQKPSAGSWLITVTQKRLAGQRRTANS